jgi:hypothetical protein
MTQRSKTLTGLVAAIVILLVLAGCASEPSLTPGTYTSTITREDSTSYGFIGEWELTLTEENGYTVSKDGQVDEKGNYTLTQDQIVFDQTEAMFACGGDGTYQWASDGKTLTLTTVEDQCEGRPFTFTTHAWSQQD